MDPDQTAPDLGSHCLVKEACIGEWGFKHISGDDENRQLLL